MVKLLSKIADSEPILIKQIAAETNRLLEAGARIISLGQGVPNLPILEASRDAIIEMATSRKFPYTDVQGLSHIRDTVAAFANTIYTSTPTVTQIEFTRDNVLLTTGAVQAVYNVLALSIEEKSDIVLCPLPAYGLYKHQTQILGGSFRPIVTSKEHDFIPTGDDILHAFRSTKDSSGNFHARSIVLCYPNNPLGCALTSSQALNIATALDSMLQDYYKQHNFGFSVILDEVYVGIGTHTATSAHISILQYASPLLAQHCFVVISGSKGLGSMPGVRIGALLSLHQPYMSNMLKIQMAVTANACSLSQHAFGAALAYLHEHPNAINDITAHYMARTRRVVEGLNAIGLKYFNNNRIASQPSATFYVFADFSSLRHASITTDIQLGEYLRDMYKHGKHIGVTVIPGSAFGIDKHQLMMRFACSVDEDAIEIALEVIDDAFAMLTGK